MPNYKIAVSKNGKKYTIVFKSDNENTARERVHSEWYSILGLEEVLNKTDLWNFFIFEWYKDWEIKHWKIVWKDIFKVYVKLKKDLEYDITLLYNEKDEWLSKEDKEKIIKELKEEYDLFYNKRKKDTRLTNIEKLKKNNYIENNNNNKDLDSFYLKKELEDVNKLIDHILEKLDNLILWENKIILSNKKLEKLKFVYNEIVKLKKTTNISKLRQIWELALIKIWNIELVELEKLKNSDSRKLLKDTNILLKKIWSSDKFVEKDRDIKYQYWLFIERIKSIFIELFKKEKIEEIDKESHSYIKNLLLISKYKQRYKENTKYIVLNFYKLIFNKKLKEETFLARDVIKQNLVLLKAREKWVNYSYTLIKKGINKFFYKIIEFSKNSCNYLFWVIIGYTIIFFIYLNFSIYFRANDYNYDGIFYFIIIIFIYFLLSFSRSIFLLTINFVFLIFIIIFWVINF